MRSFDLIVIGSGSCLEVSSEAVARGLSVAVVEHGPFGKDAPCIRKSPAWFDSPCGAIDNWDAQRGSWLSDLALRSV